jgi:hypothetical protein
MNKIPKEAVCIRNASSWAHVKAEHKFDSPKFDKNYVLSQIPIMSPKIDALLEKIRMLDDEDVKSYGKYFKHIIYSDVGGVNGAKMVSSALIANGFTLVYNNGLQLKNDNLEKNKTFGLLTTSTIYKKPLPVRLKKNMMLRMNERPVNVNGENMRIIVLDPGFKEGIDVFDVKYMHLLEPLVTKAEQTQVIGRGTRFCGQAGLSFIPNKGWPLHVYRYNMMYDDNTNVHELYLKYSNQNISALNFIADLEDLVVTSAVDLPLTEKIHMLDKKNNRFYNLMKSIKASLKNKAPVAKPVRKDFVRIVNNIRGKIYTNDQKLDCKMNCKGPLELAPTAILMIAAIHVAKKELVKPLAEKFAKPLLCRFVGQMPEYCSAINQLWMSPIRFLKLYKSKILNDLDYYRRAMRLHNDNYNSIMSFINEYSEEQKPKVMNPIYPAVPPPMAMNYLDLQKYVEKHYSPYVWDEVEIKNKCIQDTPEDEGKSKKNYEIVSFTKTQGFVQNFLTPQSPYKGLFLYHSVGSGKTCSAIATATNTFDKQGYTILWVTRHTLKEDIWKNMFDKICNVIIQERVRRGEKMPASRAERMKLLGDNWIQPISYKQFTNLIRGKNKFYQAMVARNGKQDPFRKTLVIIDEIHKIYSNSLSALEKPSPEVLQGMIQNSFEKSGKDSLKLLIMTATPITEDPMSCVKIINLLMPIAEQFPEDFGKFKNEYCQDNGLFTENGAIKFMNKVAGLISYIDRSQDRSSFAYPIIDDIMLRVDDGSRSFATFQAHKERLRELEEQLQSETSKDGKKQIKAEIKDVKKMLKAAEKAKNEPHNVIDYINNCFTKDKKKVGKKGKSVRSLSSMSSSSGRSKGSNKKKQAKPPKAPEGQKDCPPGKVRNPATGRCVKIKEPKQPKQPKQPKEPKQPKQPKQQPKDQKSCPEGKVRNPLTGRCISDPSLKPKRKSKKDMKLGGG